MGLLVLEQFVYCREKRCQFPDTRTPTSDFRHAILMEVSMNRGRHNRSQYNLILFVGSQKRVPSFVWKPVYHDDHPDADPQFAQSLLCPKLAVSRDPDQKPRLLEGKFVPLEILRGATQPNHQSPFLGFL